MSNSEGEGTQTPWRVYLLGEGFIVSVISTVFSTLVIIVLPEDSIVGLNYLHQENSGNRGIIWDPTGYHILRLLPKGHFLNHFRDIYKSIFQSHSLNTTTSRSSICLVTVKTEIAVWLLLRRVISLILRHRDSPI
jgi:hypothetical protein